jgi:anaerobic magnesium-protoporphyrin IX monomethyl ester cyclase
MSTVTLPLGLAYIAGTLQAAGHPFHILDAVGEAPQKKTRYHRGYLIGLPLEEIAENIPESTTIVGITVVFTHEWPAIVRLMDLIRQARPDLPIVIGGEHVTSMPEFCLATSKADYIVIGEGEETVLELLDALKRDGPLNEIKGLGYRENGEITVNSRRARRLNLDDIPRPAWEQFAVDTYNQNGYVGGINVGAKTIPILATRGCPYQCTYCSSPNMWTPRWIPRDPIMVVDEIQHYVDVHGATNFPFQDLTAILHKDWIKAFCEEILNRGLKITWQLPTGTRSEAIDKDVARLLKSTGLATMSYAPESGSEHTRKLIKKRMKTENLMASVQAAIASELNVALFIVIGFPHDEPEHLEQNFEFLRHIRRLGVQDMAIGYYMALPGTEIFNSLYDAGKITLDQDYFGHILQGLALWPATSYNPAMPRWELVKWKFRLYLAFYSEKCGPKGEGGLTSNIFRALTGVFSKKHDSRLQTAFKNGLISIWDSVVVRFVPYWIPMAEERAMFATWDKTFRQIRHQLLDGKIIAPAPADTADIHRENVISKLRTLHDTKRSMKIESTATVS